VPLVRVTLVEDALSFEQKRDLVGEVTDAVVRVAGEGLRPAVWVMIDEVPASSWGVGGQPLGAAG
jgi:4-oxalocrotonate tautomerase